MLQCNAWRQACEQQTTSVEDLRAEAKDFFGALCTSTSTFVATANLTLTTKPSHNKALAKLIASFDPIFRNGRYVSRVAALSCLRGALDGTEGVGVAKGILQTVGPFLLSNCGPIEEEQDDYEEMDEKIRDMAMRCLASLVRSKDDTTSMAGNDADQPNVREDPKTNSGAGMDDTTNWIETARMRLVFAQKGVERRCAAAALDDDIDDVNGDPMDLDSFKTGFEPSGEQLNQDIGGGLSTLPRSRRTLCFNLLDACVDGIMKLMATATAASSSSSSSLVAEDKISSLQPQLRSLVTFAATCLGGESDPRCLQQLLLIFAKMQRQFVPYFTRPNNGSATTRFPILDLFDAVAPYYPVQFTPPPNDTHGITREGLQRAVMAILTFVQYDEIPNDRNIHNNSDNQNRNGGNAASSSRTGEYDYATDQDSMLNLSAGIFLERLTVSNSDGTNNNTDGSGGSASEVADKLDGVRDFGSLLFPTAVRTSNKNSTDTSVAVASNCHLMSVETVREAALCLSMAYHEAISAITLNMNAGVNKELADAIRRLVARIAGTLEGLQGSETALTSQLWKVFVIDPLSGGVAGLSSSPQTIKSKSFATYAASMACGGPKTLNATIGHCFPHLVQVIESDVQDEEKSCAAVYAVLAFLSSYKTYCERQPGGTFPLQPNPLAGHQAKLFAFVKNTLIDSDSHEPSNTKVASIRLAESLFGTLPASVVGESEVSLFSPTADILLDLVLKAPLAGTSEQDQAMFSAASHALGGFLATAITDKTKKTETDETPDQGGADMNLDGNSVGSGCMPMHSILLDSDTAKTKLETELLPKILLSILQLRTTSTTEATPVGLHRWDLAVCMVACRDSVPVARLCFDRLLRELLDSLYQNKYESKASAVHVATTTSFLIRSSGSVGRRAIQSLDIDSFSPKKVVDALCSSFPDDALPTLYGHSKSMSNLRIPSIEVEGDTAKKEATENVVSRNQALQQQTLLCLVPVGTRSSLSITHGFLPTPLFEPIGLTRPRCTP